MSYRLTADELEYVICALTFQLEHDDGSNPPPIAAGESALEKFSRGRLSDRQEGSGMRFKFIDNTSHQDVVFNSEDDSIEFQWGLNDDGTVMSGYAGICKDGTLCIPFRTHAADEPFVFVINENGARIVSSEDVPPFEEPDERAGVVVWDAEGER